MTPDMDTGRPRQRDVWIETSIGGHFPIKLLVSCKRYKRKLSAQGIDAFIGELLSSGAHKGVIYSSSGFTKAALEKAIKRGISCCVLLVDQPPPIPDVLIFEAYYYREGYRLLAGSLEGDPNWPFLLGHKIEVEDQILPIYKLLARKFETQRRPLEEAVGKVPLPGRRVMLTTTILDQPDTAEFGVESAWTIYRARKEAWLVNGSYSFTDGNFKGSFAAPAIDTWTGEPCAGWEQIDADQVGTGSAANFYVLLGNLEPALAALTPEPPPHEFNQIK